MPSRPYGTGPLPPRRPHRRFRHHQPGSRDPPTVSAASGPVGAPPRASARTPASPYPQRPTIRAALMSRPARRAIPARWPHVPEPTRSSVPTARRPRLRDRVYVAVRPPKHRLSVPFVEPGFVARFERRHEALPPIRAAKQSNPPLRSLIRAPDQTREAMRYALVAAPLSVFVDGAPWQRTAFLPTTRESCHRTGERTQTVADGRRRRALALLRPRPATSPSHTLHPET